MPQFHTLEVANVQKTTRDAVILTLKPVDDLADFTFIPGQYLTFKQDFQGHQLRRSYSICAGLDDGELRVAVKRVEGGSFSNWVNDSLRIGDFLQSMTPKGAFSGPNDADDNKHYLALAGGSGITPILSIIKTTLTRNAYASITLLYANKSVNSVMFREELEDLKNRFMGRLNIIHVLEEDAQEVELFTGRINAEKLTKMFNGLVDISSVDRAFICGPEPMMLEITKCLRDHGMDKNKIRYELFSGGQVGRAERRPDQARLSKTDESLKIGITIEGTTRTVAIKSGSTSILEAALENDIDAPYSCRAGICATCKAKVVTGEVEMIANHALEDYEVEQGYVLTCQCYPIGDGVLVDYDG